jgi:hypothetical protein
MYLFRYLNLFYSESSFSNIYDMWDTTYSKEAHKNEEGMNFWKIVDEIKSFKVPTE